MATERTIRLEALRIVAQAERPTPHIHDLLRDAEVIVEYVTSGKQPEADDQSP